MAQVEDLKILLKVKDAGGTQVIEKIQNQLRGLQRAALPIRPAPLELTRSLVAFAALMAPARKTLRLFGLK